MSVSDFTDLVIRANQYDVTGFKLIVSHTIEQDLLMQVVLSVSVFQNLAPAEFCVDL